MNFSGESVLIVLSQGQPELFRIRSRSPVELEFRYPEAVDPDDVGHPLAIDPVVDDERALARRQGGEEGGLHRSRSGAGQQDGRIVSLGARDKGLQQLLPNALEQIRELGLAMADVRAAQG